MKVFSPLTFSCKNTSSSLFNFISMVFYIYHMFSFILSLSSHCCSLIPFRRGVLCIPLLLQLPFRLLVFLLIPAFFVYFIVLSTLFPHPYAPDFPTELHPLLNLFLPPSSITSFSAFTLRSASSSSSLSFMIFLFLLRLSFLLFFPSPQTFSLFLFVFLFRVQFLLRIFASFFFTISSFNFIFSFRFFPLSYPNPHFSSGLVFHLPFDLSSFFVFSSSFHF